MTPPNLLNSTTPFPDPALAPDEGLVAIGGDFTIPRLLAAYRHGIFPWTANPITWWSPNPRGIIDLPEFHTPKSLAKLIRQRTYHVTIDTAFPQVIRACATGPTRTGQVWITPEFIDAYTRLHHAGHAHSVECWHHGQLVGGIYGVALGGLFAGESMFHHADNASKVALHHLVQHLRTRHFTLFDIQMVTPATLPLGAKNIPRTDYLRRLAQAVQLPCQF